MLAELGIASVDSEGGFRIDGTSPREPDGEALIPFRVNGGASRLFMIELSAAIAASK